MIFRNNEKPVHSDNLSQKEEIRSGRQETASFRSRTSRTQSESSPIEQSRRRRVEALIAAGILFFSGLGCSKRQEETQLRVVPTSITEQYAQPQNSHEWIDVNLSNQGDLPVKEHPPLDASDQEIEAWFTQREAQKTEPLLLSKDADQRLFENLGEHAEIAHNAYHKFREDYPKLISFLQQEYGLYSKTHSLVSPKKMSDISIEFFNGRHRDETGINFANAGTERREYKGDGRDRAHITIHLDTVRDGTERTEQELINKIVKVLYHEAVHATIDTSGPSRKIHEACTEILARRFSSKEGIKTFEAYQREVMLIHAIEGVPGAKKLLWDTYFNGSSKSYAALLNNPRVRLLISDYIRETQGKYSQ